jgi:hypothetical protein
MISPPSATQNNSETVLLTPQKTTTFEEKKPMFETILQTLLNPRQRNFSEAFRSRELG